MVRILCAACIGCALTWAQTPGGSLTFEVASIEPAAPQAMGRMMMGMRGGPGTGDPGQVTFSNMPLNRLIMTAYDVRSFQVSGPSWMDSEHFDVTAKIPQGTTKEQFHFMLQNLLAERFKLVVHKDKKQEAIYALVVAKGGIKMKEAANDAPAEEAMPGKAPVQFADNGDGRGPRPVAIGKDGAPRMPPGGRGVMMMIGPNGFRMQGAQVTMAMLAEVLSDQVGRPVMDMTGLTGKYDYALNFSPEGLGGMRGMPMPMGPPPGAGGGPGPESSSTADSGPSIFAAVQEQLGLKLESRKGPVDLIVVDSVEKTPTEN